MKKFHLISIALFLNVFVNAQCGITYVADTSGLLGFNMTFDFSGLSDPLKGSAQVYVEDSWGNPHGMEIFTDQMFFFEYMTLNNANYRYYGVVTDTTTGCQDSIGDIFVILNQNGGFMCDAHFGYTHDSLAMDWSFFSTAYYNPPGCTYFWYVGDGSSYWGDTIYHSYTYEIIKERPVDLNVQGPGCEYSSNMGFDTITTGYLQECAASFDLFADSIQGDTYWAYNNSYGGFISHYWEFGDGGTSTDPFPTYVYDTPGQYNLCLTVNDTSGCQSIFCDTIDVLFKSTGTTLNVLDPNASSGIGTSFLSQIELYPNPSNGNFILEYFVSTPEKVEFLVHDLNGRIIYRRILAHGVGKQQQIVKLPDIEPGVYIYSLNGYSRKLVIE